MAKRMGRWGKTLAVLVVGLGLIALGIRLRYGGGETFPNRTTAPTFAADAAEVVAELPMPPGNIAVGPDGRIFITFHPDAHPDIKVAELIDGKARAYPDPAFQSEREGLWFHAPLSLRIDRQGHLWVLDQANHGSGDAKLLSFDLKTGKVVRQIHFDRALAGLGSHLNDFAVHPDGNRIYIAEASIFAQTPALIVYRRSDGKARRLLEGHPSVMPEPYYITVDGSPIEPLGLFAVRPGVDSIALDRKGEWLYFGAVTASKMYRVPVAALDDEGLTAPQLAERVEVFAEKTQSDGITSDDAGNLYLSDPEHNAVVRLGPDGKLETLLADKRFRWPDGFSFGPKGWLYFTCSALQHVILKSKSHVVDHAPYHVYRFKPGPVATPGH
jgi:sugar lactone lactonase YvrE